MEVQTAARALEARGRDVVHMEIGEPDFPTPEPVLAAAREALADGGIYYTSALGLPALREAIARHYRDHLGVDVDPARVVVTAGSSAALLLVCALLVDRDDRILMADPSYPCNRHFVRSFEGEAVALPTGPASGYQLDAAMVARHWDARTRGVLVASPSNPTGTTIARDEMARIADTVAARGGHLVVDEIYLGLSYDDREPRAALRAGARRRRLRDLELLQVLQHDRLAPGLGDRARAPRARPREARAEPVHLAADALAARRARLLRAGDDRDPRGTPAGVPRAPRPARPRAPRPRLRHPGDADRRLLRLRRRLALRPGQPRVLRGGPRARRRRDHPRDRLRHASRARARALRLHDRARAHRRGPRPPRAPPRPRAGAGPHDR